MNDELCEAVVKAKNALMAMYLTNMKFIEALEKALDKKDDVDEFLMELVKVVPHTVSIRISLDNYTSALNGIHEAMKSN